DLDQLQVLDALRAVLVGLSERAPVLLVLEDLHWADRATRDLVAFLARTLRSGRVAMAVSYRSDDLRAGPAAPDGTAGAGPVHPVRAGRPARDDRRCRPTPGAGRAHPRPLGGQPVLRRAAAGRRGPGRGG